jgi:hypothetical protein
MAASSNCRDAIVEIPKFNRCDLDHSKLSLSHTYRNGPADAQFQQLNLGLCAKIKFGGIGSHSLASASQAENISEGREVKVLVMWYFCHSVFGFVLAWALHGRLTFAFPTVRA